MAALLLLAAALSGWPPAYAPVSRRVREARLAERLTERVRQPHTAPVASRIRGTPSALAAPVRRRAFAGIAGLAAGLLVGGTLGVGVGVVGAVVGDRLLSRSAPGDTRSTERRRDLPGACDLLAVCLSAGMPLTGALDAVASAVPGPVGDDLARAAALGRLGADAHRCWSEVAEELRPLARAVQRAAGSGASAVPALTALAADCRARARADTEAAVRRAGVRVLMPLGVCFLPAFVCLGVVPLVLGVAGDVLRGG